MTPPTVLLDRSFLEALVDPGHPDFSPAMRCYTRLLDTYETNRARLHARHDHLDAVDRTLHADLLAPLEAIHVAAQFRRQAERLGDAYPDDLAVTLVVMRRERIGRIATFDPYFDTLDLTIER